MPKCPYCGLEVDARGLHAHEGSLNCQLYQARRAIKEERLEKCGNFSHILKAGGIKIRYLLTSYVPGYVGRKARPHYSDFAPREAVMIYRALRDRKTPRDEIVAFLKSPEGKRVLDAIKLLLLLNASEEAINQTLKAMLSPAKEAGNADGG